MKYLLALIMMAALAAPSMAADPPQRWDLSRLAGGVDAGGVIYEQPEDVSAVSGFLFGSWLSYSLSSKISAPLTAQWDWVTERYSYTAGARFALYGNRASDRVHVGVGADFVHYEGPGYAGLGLQDSWRGTIKATWSMLVDEGGRTIIYLPMWVDYDPENGLTRYVAALRWQVFGGK